MNEDLEDLTLMGDTKDILLNLESTNKTRFSKGISVLKEKYPCLIAADKSSTQDSRTHLFILAIHDDEKDKEKCNIYVTNFKRLHHINNPRTPEGQQKELDIVSVLSDYEYNVIKNLKDQKLSKKDAEDIGKMLFKTLIPNEIKTKLRNELKNESEKVEWWVWIYSDVDEFNPIWEWLYTSPKPPNNTKQSNVANQKTMDKNSSKWKEKISNFIKREPKPKNKLSKESKMEQPQENEKEEGFFWGDAFSIIRVPKNCDFEIERSESQINSVAILFDDDCKSARSDEKCLFDLCRHYSIDPSQYNFTSNSPNALPIMPFDYMHIAADIGIIEKNYVKFNQALSMAATSLSTNLNIFYNIWNAKKRDAEKQRSIHNIQLKVMDSIPAKTRIYTIFDVQEDFAALFAKCFYECSIEENDVAKAVKKAREEIKNGYLFSTTNSELEKALKDQNIRKLKEIFKSKHHITLSDPVIVENIAEENGIGMISANEKTYNVKKKDGKLTFYETGRNLSFNRFCRFAYAVYGNPFTAAIWARS
jgi:hypothetical protein